MADLNNSNSIYYDAYGSIMNIILSDENVTLEEKQVLQGFGEKLGISSDEYFDLLETYKNFEVKPIITRKKRIADFYKIAFIVVNHATNKQIQTRWLEKMGVAIGFSVVNIKYIVLKTLDLFKSGEFLDEDIFVEEIKNMNR